MKQEFCGKVGSFDGEKLGIVQVVQWRRVVFVHFAVVKMINSVGLCKVWELEYAKSVFELETVYHFRLFGYGVIVMITLVYFGWERDYFCKHLTVLLNEN